MIGFAGPPTNIRTTFKADCEASDGEAANITVTWQRPASEYNLVQVSKAATLTFYN